MKRHTSQRSAIEEVFRTIDRPLSIDEILEAGRRKVGTLNQATVYRNLKILVQDGRLTRVHAPEGGVRYERSGKGHHHHFQCRACNRLFEIAGCAYNARSMTPPGFVTEDHEVYLYGICPSCRGGLRRRGALGQNGGSATGTF